MLVVTKLDRLARSVPHLCEIGKRLDAKGVGLKVLDQAIDTTTPTGRLMFNMLGAIAQFERELIRERMLVGIAKAKAEGKYKGRAPTARAQAEKVRQLKHAGVGPSEIARQVGISRTSVFRILTAAYRLPNTTANQAPSRGLFLLGKGVKWTNIADRGKVIFKPLILKSNLGTNRGSLESSPSNE